MSGAIAGDIIGSVYEWNNIKTKDFPLFGQNAHFTDDTVLTVALADSILTGTPYAENLRTSLYHGADVLLLNQYLGGMRGG
jgi:ADP-ribosylglycohydrolase